LFYDNISKRSHGKGLTSLPVSLSSSGNGNLAGRRLPFLFYHTPRENPDVGRNFTKNLLKATPQQDRVLGGMPNSQAAFCHFLYPIQKHRKKGKIVFTIRMPCVKMYAVKVGVIPASPENVVICGIAA